MEPVTLAIIAAAGLLLASGKKKGRPSGGGSYRERFRVDSKEERIAVMNDIRSMSAWYSNEFGSMPFLADFLTVTAFRESRFNPAAFNQEVATNPNKTMGLSALGLFGQRPDFMFKKANGLESLKSKPYLIHNPKWAFVTAVYHIWDADQTAISKSGREADWAAVRRWWGYPSKVDDFDMMDEFSQKSAMRFEEAIHDCNSSYGTNIDPDFMWMPVESDGYPGMDVMLKAFGLKK